MGQYLGGVANVVVGFYTGNVWEMAGGVMQIVGTKTGNKDLATAGAVVGTVAGVAGAASAASAGSDAASGSSAVGGASQSADLTATAANTSAAAGGSSTLPDSLQLSTGAGTTAGTAATTAAANGANSAQSALSTWDNVKSALSTPTGAMITAGAIGGIGNAYGQAYAAQKNAEAQQALQNQSIAFRQWQANIANTAGTGVVNAAAPMQYGTGLLGPISAAPAPTGGLPASPNPLAPTPIPGQPNPNPAGLTV